MDITLKIRDMGRSLEVDPHYVLIPRSSDNVNQSMEQWVMKEGGAMSMERLARDYYEATQWNGSIDYFMGASELLEEYITLTRDTTPYYLTLLDELLTLEENVDEVVTVYNEYRNSIGERAVTIDSLNIAIDQWKVESSRALNESIDYYETYVAPVVEALSGVSGVQVISSSISPTSVRQRVSYNGYDITRSTLGEIVRNISLNERVFYATHRSTIGDVVRQLRIESVIDKEDLPTSGNDDLLILVTLPNKPDRVVRINTSSIIESNDNEALREVFSALPLLTFESTEDTLYSATFAYPISDYIPAVLYYLIRMYEPWLDLLGVDDSNYNKRLRNLILRSNRWPIQGSGILEREQLHTVRMSHGANIVVGEEIVEGVSFNVRDAPMSIVRQLGQLAEKLVADYDNKKDEILSIYDDLFPSLLSPLPVRAVAKSKQLELLRPDLFSMRRGVSSCRRPILSNENDEDATLVSLPPSLDNPDAPTELYLKCAENQILEMRLIDGIEVPCCTTQNKRSVINYSTIMEEGNEGYLYGIATTFGYTERSRKGESAVVRVGMGGTLKRVLTKLIPNLYIPTRIEEVSPFLQCMWDYSEEEVVEYLGREWDSDKVLDGIALHNRVNIFVLENVDNNLLLRVPSYRFAYYLPYCYDRDSIVLFRHPRGTAYELVRPTASRNYRMDATVTERLITLFRSHHRTELLTRDGSYLSLQDRAPYLEKDMRVPGIQIIDSYGKMRGYQSETGLILYYEHPSAPLLGPYTRYGDETLNRTAYLEGLHEGEVVERNLATNNVLIGLPTSLHTPSDTSVELSWVSDSVRRYNSLNRERSYLLQLTNWIYSNARREMPLSQFLEMIVVDNEVAYNFDLPNSELGVYAWRDAMRYIEPTGLTRVNDGVYNLLYPNNYIVDSIIQMLTAADWSYDSSPPIPDSIVTLEYNRTSSLLGEDNVLHRQLYLVNDASYSEWRASLRVHNNSSITNLANPRVRSYKFPFTVVSTGVQGTRWLIQNVANGNYRRAVQCSANWLENRVNSGYYTEQCSDEDSIIGQYTTLYSWNEGGLIEPLLATQTEGVTLNVLIYPDYKVEGTSNYRGHYAALLPLVSS